MLLILALKPLIPKKMRYAVKTVTIPFSLVWYHEIFAWPLTSINSSETLFQESPSQNLSTLNLLQQVVRPPVLRLGRLQDELLVPHCDEGDCLCEHLGPNK